jgi:remodeling and spacing factor 1
VSESSLDLPSKKGKINKRSTRSAARNRRYEETFINDNSSDDEPLIKKRTRKQVDSDEEEFDANDSNDEVGESDGSTANEIDSDDLCDDTETDDSSEGNWPKKKKKRVASYDIKKPKKAAKKNDEEEDRAFRAGISKKKILKKDSENEGSNDNGSGSDNVKGRRKTRGKKLLYLIEDDYESDDGIKPGNEFISINQ